LAKAFLPQAVWGPIRQLLTGLLTPIRFSLWTGHFRSSLAAKAVDCRGMALPWYTYPAIDFLGAKDFSEKTVLEFGSGQSTLWWSERAKRIVTLESDKAWLRRVESRNPRNTRLHFVPDDLTGLDGLVAGERFDIVVIDGHDRGMAARRAVDLIGPEGGILLDDSEGYWGGEVTHDSPVLNLFRSLNFLRIDFYGFAPGVISPHCTSLFCRAESFLLRGDEDVVRNKFPTGGPANRPETPVPKGLTS
jgi:hypothetical protein